MTTATRPRPGWSFNCPRGALYHYFDSKEAILFAILDAPIREMIADVEAAMAG